MIEINLVPDVKQQLISAQRVRVSVISLSFLVGIASIGAVVLLGFWVFAVQLARGAIADSTIKDQQSAIAKVPDIENTLTIQNQLSKLTTLHESKNIDSRIFDILTTINPPAPNNVTITTLTLDAVDKTVKIEAQAANSYQALDVFKKTLEATTLQYSDEEGKSKTVKFASEMSDSDRSYGQDTQGAKVLRFTLLFTYADELFSPSIKNARIVAPSQANATDSFLGVPQSLFTSATNSTSENQ